MNMLKLMGMELGQNKKKFDDIKTQSSVNCYHLL